jgi:hypothetical protein
MMKAHPPGSPGLERAVALVAALALTGCFNPDDIFPVKGALSSPDSVSGQAVRLLRQSTLASSGTCAGATPFKSTTTDDAGAYGFEIFRAQAQRLTGFGQFCFRVDTSFPSGGGSFIDLQQVSGELRLPPLLDWRAAPRLEDGGLSFTAAGPRPSPEGQAEGRSTALHHVDFLTSDGGVAWRLDERADDLAGLPQPLELSSEVLEDFSGRLELTARVTHGGQALGPFGGDTFTVEARSGDVLPVAGTRVPLSRGLECPGFGSPCPFTDGSLERADAGAAQALRFTLPVPRPVSTVVLRGVEMPANQLLVSITTPDGGRFDAPFTVPVSTWTLPELPVREPGGVPGLGGPRPIDADAGLELPVFAPVPAWSVLRFDAGVEAASVRLLFPAGLGAAQEISLYE